MKNRRICEQNKEKSEKKKEKSGKKISPGLRGSESGSSSYTKSLKFDMNFSNSGTGKKKKDALISEKYRKLEKIYESLSKE